MKYKLFGLSLVALAIFLAIFQLIRFDNAIAHVSGWTDGQANSWTVYSPHVDVAILFIIIVLTSTGIFFSLHTKRTWLRILIAILVGLATWVIFYMLQLSIQHHLSHFMGV